MSGGPARTVGNAARGCWSPARADDALLHVATSRHAGEVTVFAGRDEVDTEQEQHDGAQPRTSAELTSLVLGRMAEHAERTRPRERPADRRGRGRARQPRSGRMERSSDEDAQPRAG